MDLNHSSLRQFEVYALGGVVPISLLRSRSLSENSLLIKYFTQKISSSKSVGRHYDKIMGKLLKNSPFSYECSAIYPL